MTRHGLNHSCAAAIVLRPTADLIQEARESFLLAIQHDPRGMKLSVSANIGMTYYFERDYQKAANSFRRTLADNPTDPQALRWFAAALGQLGRTDEASSALSEARANAPDAFGRWTRQRPLWYRRPEDYKHMLDGLRKAGWQGENDNLSASETPTQQSNDGTEPCSGRRAFVTADVRALAP